MTISPTSTHCISFASNSDLLMGEVLQRLLILDPLAMLKNHIYERIFSSVDMERPMQKNDPNIQYVHARTYTNQQ